MFVVFVVRLHTVSGGGELGRIGTARNDKKILKVKKQKNILLKFLLYLMAPRARQVPELTTSTSCHMIT